MAGLTVNWNEGMAGFIDSCYERYEADLRARGLVSCLPCGGTGSVHAWGPPPMPTRILGSDEVTLGKAVLQTSKCTLCSGKGITHPPPTTTIGWYNPRSYWDIDL